MYTSLIRACLLLFVFILPVTAHAAGLGKLTINSALGQPFNAEIDLVTVNAEDLTSLRANIAAPEAYAQAGLQYAPFFATFSLSLEQRASGEPYIRLTSPQSVNEPFLNLLVELNWAAGRLLREYTVLLDPADTRRPEPVAPVVHALPETPVVTESQPSAVAQPTQTAPQAEQVAQSSQPAQPQQAPVTQYAGTTYGPVLQGDTLSSIANQVKPDGVNVNQMLVALFRANREAFIANNMNLLKTGVVLTIPDVDDLSSITRQQADAEVKLQVSDWQKYRQNLASTVQQGNEQDALRQTDSGQITTTVNDAVITAREDSQEVLRLSSGEYVADASQAQAHQNAVERLRMMEEDAIARNLALQEANERIAMLENNINNLQKLLALQNPELAQAQIQAEDLTEAGTQTPAETQEAVVTSAEPAVSESAAMIDATPSAEVLQPDANVDPDDAFLAELELLAELDSLALEMENADALADETAAATETPAAEPDFVAPAVTPETQGEAQEVSFMGVVMDMLMDNLMIVGAILIILPLIFVMMKLRNRRKAREAEEEAEEAARQEESAAALRSKAAAAVAAGHADSALADDDNDAFDQDANYFQNDGAQDETSQAQSDFATAEEPVQTDGNASDSDQSFELDFSDETESAVKDESSQPTDDLADFDPLMSETMPQTAEAATNESDNELAFDTTPDGDALEPEQSAQSGSMDGDDDHLLDFPEKDSAEPDDDFALNIDFDATDEAGKEKGAAEVEALEIDLTDESVQSSGEETGDAQQEAEKDSMLDFSVDPSTIDLSDEPQSDELPDEQPATPLSDDKSIDMPDLLDLDIDDTDATDKSTSVQTDAAPDAMTGGTADTADKDDSAAEIDFSDIDLDIEKDGTSDSVADAAVETGGDAEPQSGDAGAKTEQWHEVETKIDLARAYIDMEDKEGAREMLEEAMQEGDAQQQETAQALLKDL